MTSPAVWPGAKHALVSFVVVVPSMAVWGRGATYSEALTNARAHLPRRRGKRIDMPHKVAASDKHLSVSTDGPNLIVDTQPDSHVMVTWEEPK